MFTYLSIGMDVGHDIMLAAFLLNRSDPKVVVRDDEMLLHLADSRLSDGVDAELPKQRLISCQTKNRDKGL